MGRATGSAARLAEPLLAPAAQHSLRSRHSLPCNALTQQGREAGAMATSTLSPPGATSVSVGGQLRLEAAQQRGGSVRRHACHGAGDTRQQAGVLGTEGLHGECGCG